MQLHLLDATYELFRAHFGRPPHAGADGQPAGATLGVVESTLSLLREDGVTHLGAATDHVIRSWRNDRFAGYKTDAGMPPELLAQFPLVEQALQAIGVVLWPMVEFEADDALGAAAARWAEDPLVERVVILSPDKDMAQCVREDGRVVTYDRRKRLFVDADGVREKFGVSPASIPDFLALVGDTFRRLSGHPRLGRRVHRGRAAPLPPPRGHPRVGPDVGRRRAGRRDPRRGAPGAPRRGAAVPGAGTAPPGCADPAAFRGRAALARACRARRSRHWSSGWRHPRCVVASLTGRTRDPSPEQASNVA